MSKSSPSASRSTAGDETALHARIHALVLAARQTVARGVDLIQVRTNFEIGRHIVEHEQQGQARASYGKDVLKNLAQVLTVEFGSGFSLTNLKLMRQFYLQNVDRMGQTSSDLSVPEAIGQTLSDRSSAFRLSWSHCVFLLGIKNPNERSFYEIEACDQSWTLRELKRQFDSGLFERLTHQDLGQMQMYVNYFDRFVKAEDENATVGIVLCKKKNEALVEITLPADANIHAREYQLYLPSKEELQRKLQEWVGEVGA